ncbi:30384_t:CDS:2 [Racocetra persica]|uniref:30384_t:CDS:1 n=1 Tax=Racocetra persica TaxID=160502 RepID=A0ACA9K7Q3_9GLOM|nr:30384_t:CDS:2 [Racocetra persica]
MTDVEIRGNLLDAFLGGVDTVKQKIVAEIDPIFPPNTPFNLKYEDLLKLEYCDAIINEARRISSVATDIPIYVEGLAN